MKAQSCVRNESPLLCSPGLVRRAVNLDGAWGILSARSAPPSEHRSVPDVGTLGHFAGKHKKQVPNKNIPSFNTTYQCNDTKSFRDVKSQSIKIRYFHTDFLPCRLKFSTYHWDTVCRNFLIFGPWQVELYILRNIIFQKSLTSFGIWEEKSISSWVWKQDKVVSATTFLSNYCL